MLFRHWEGFWWQDDVVESVDYTNKSAFSWISVIRLPTLSLKLILTGGRNSNEKEET